MFRPALLRPALPGVVILAFLALGLSGLPGLIGGLAAGAAGAQSGYAKLSPFEDVRWKKGEPPIPEVKLDGTWYVLLAIDDAATADILAACEKRWPGDAERRFEEDLVEALSRMGHEPGATVDLKVRPVGADEGAEPRTLEAVPMTRENRDRLRDARDAAERARREVRRVKRTHATKSPRELDFLTDRIERAPAGAARMLTRKQAEQDLDQLEWLVEHTHSYRDRLGVDYRAAFDTIRASLGDGISQGAFLVQLQKALALLGDGHTRVRGRFGALPEGYLPFDVADARGRVLAYDREKGELLEDGHPYLQSLDGLALEHWLEQAEEMGARGPAHLVRFAALQQLVFVAALRQELGLGAGPKLRVELESEDGKSTRVRMLDISPRPRLAPAEERPKWDVLPGEIGYIVIPSMSGDKDVIEGMHTILDRVRDTKGLIIDVRGNGGGSRRILRELFPYFMKRGDRPHVANVAAYRLPGGRAELGDGPESPEGYLAARFLYPARSSRWSSAEREAIAAVARGFEPEWTPPPEDFSAWHYLVLSPSTDERVYHYGKPVVVLQDEGCFSATDIFLGAFSGWRDVILLGTTSGGGSGFSREHVLENSKLQVRVSTMASFRPDGRLYDGRGVEPDVVVHPTIADHLGDGDSLLEAAVDRLR